MESDHRSEVLSILVKLVFALMLSWHCAVVYRLLYGHMMQSGHGPARGMTRRKIVLRFLSNCEGSIDELLALILVPFKQLMGLCVCVCVCACVCVCVRACVQLHHNIICFTTYVTTDQPVNNFSVDPAKVIPLKKQQGSVHTLMWNCYEMIME